MNQSRSLASIFIFLLIVSLLVGLVWGNYQLAKDNFMGAGFSIQWISIHSLVKSDVSPYSDQVTSQIQETVKEENNFAAGNRPKYTSPLYSAVVIFPFTLLGNLTLAHALWLTFQLIAIFILIFLGIRLTAWRPAWYTFLLFSLFSIFSYHIIVPWLDGGLSIWAALFLGLAALSIYFNKSELGGISLAMAAIQPQMVLLPVIFILIWSGFQRRKLLILWFFVTVILLSIIGFLLVPDWIIQYLRILYRFQQNFPPGSPGILFKSIWPGLGKQLGWLVSGILSLILIIEWWLAIKKDFRRFLWTLCLTVVIAQWIGIPTIPGNFSLLILPLILVSALLTERIPRNGQWIAVLVALLIFVWEWALFYIDLIGSQPKMQSNLIIPLPLVLFISLYWVRWWAIKPRRTMLEELRLGQNY